MCPGRLPIVTVVAQSSYFIVLMYAFTNPCYVGASLLNKDIVVLVLSFLDYCSWIWYKLSWSVIGFYKIFNRDLGSWSWWRSYVSLWIVSTVFRDSRANVYNKEGIISKSEENIVEYTTETCILKSHKFII